jgi:hypothetical protein
VKAATAASDQSPKLKPIPISEYQVGFQVPAENPTGEKDFEFGETVDPPHWRKVVLLASKTDGTTADVTLLRPLWWLEKQHAQVGGTIEIHVPECSISGPADVLAIEPCPAIKPRSGLRIVTGTFRHHAGKVVELHVEGLDEPIGTTPNHLFWSEDRQQFVRAEHLQEGERLRDFDGTPRVEKIVALSEPEPVFNLEVQYDHVYHVTANGVLVHNSAPCPIYGVHWTTLQGNAAIDAVGAIRPRNGDLVWFETATSLHQLGSILRNGGAGTGARGAAVAIIVDMRGLEARVIGGGGAAFRMPEGMVLSGPGGHGLTWWYNSGSTGEIRDILRFLREGRTSY